MKEDDKKGRPIHIGAILEKSLKAPADAPGNTMARLKGVWRHAVGPSVDRHARPWSLKGGTLMVRVDSSTWLHHLGFLKAEIIEKVNGHLGRRIITDLSLRIGSLGEDR